MERPALEARDVSKHYPGTTALAGIDLEIGRGETLVLVGESGSGKSTLLRLLNRLEEPTSGDILVDGQFARDLDAIALRRRTGYVQQEGGLLPHWTVARNVALVPRLLGWSATRTGERIDAMLELVGLPPERFRPRYPRQLSGGQRQRVAIARALAADPGVILLDEPFGALDALTRIDLQEEFVRLRDGLSKTMVMVTHDLDEAFRLGDRVAVMKEGKLVQAAPPAELTGRPADDYVRALLAHRRGTIQ
jgi:osmoprotectant transport system ATP-binding protein